MASVIRRRILIVDNSTGITGAFKSIKLITGNLSKRHDFFFAIQRGWPTNENTNISFKYLEIKRDLSLLIYIPKLLYNSVKLIRIIKKYKIDIVHVNDIYNMIGVLAKIIHPNIKLIHHIRLLPGSYIGALYDIFSKIVLKYSDKVICVSNAVYDALPMSSKKIIVYNPINSVEKYPVKTFNKRSFVKILCVGNLIQGKGQDLVIEAFKIARKKNDKILLEFIGSTGNLKKNKDFKLKLFKAIHNYQLDDFISFKSHSPDVEKEIKDADIIINLSESESFSRVCLEALSYGTPLIASDCGGPKELFEDGKSGFLVPNFDVHSAAMAILKLAESYDLRRTFSLEGKDYVKAKFDGVKILKTMDCIYNNI